MKKYITQLSDYQKNILNNSIDYEECRRKCFSILSYVVKHTAKNDGCFTKSLANFHKMYIRYHKKMSLSNFKLIISKLCDLKLIFTVKYKNRNVYFSNEKLANKMAKKISAETVDTSTIGSKNQITEIQNISKYNTNTDNRTENENIFDQLLKAYKGLSGNPILNKTELRKIAKNLFMLRGVHEAYIQNLVFSKINCSKTKIQSKGAVNYINAIITEKLVETSEYVCC